VVLLCCAVLAVVELECLLSIACLGNMQRQDTRTQQQGHCAHAAMPQAGSTMRLVQILAKVAVFSIQHKQCSAVLLILPHDASLCPICVRLAEQLTVLQSMCSISSSLQLFVHFHVSVLLSPLFSQQQGLGQPIPSQWAPFPVCCFHSLCATSAMDSGLALATNCPLLIIEK
jgi:hypothetical protein